MSTAPPPTTPTLTTMAAAPPAQPKSEIRAPIIVGVVCGLMSSLLTWGIGLYSDARKEKVQAEVLGVENRRKLFVSTTQDFAVYITQWSRLRSVSEAELAFAPGLDAMKARLKRTRTTRHGNGKAAIDRMELVEKIEAAQKNFDRIEKRKERYLEGRDAAKDRLAGDLEQVTLFYRSKDLHQRVDEFTVFDARNATKGLSELPGMEAWRKHLGGIAAAMQKEIEDDEKKAQ